MVSLRLHLDVIKFLDTHVTGRQDYIDNRNIEGDIYTWILKFLIFLMKFLKPKGTMLCKIYVAVAVF